MLNTTVDNFDKSVKSTFIDGICSFGAGYVYDERDSSCIHLNENCQREDKSALKSSSEPPDPEIVLSRIEGRINPTRYQQSTHSSIHPPSHRTT
eukprot:Awhi_evm1s13869